MPRYVCDECGEVFTSKEERAEHGHDRVSGVSRLREFSLPDLSRMQLLVLFGVFLMATLFLGPAFFYSFFSPGTGISGTSGFSEPSPPVGYSIRSQADIPQKDEVNLPGGAVSNSQLSTEAQLYLLTRPSVLLQYNCFSCPGLVQDLGNLAANYNVERNWVYVAPYRDMNATISATAFRRSAEMESFNRTRLESFICGSLSNRPVPCAFR